MLHNSVLLDFGERQAAKVFHFVSGSNVKIWRQVAARKLEIQDFLAGEMDLKQQQFCSSAVGIENADIVISTYL